MRRPLLLLVALLAGTIAVAAADPPKCNDDPAAVHSARSRAPADVNDYVIYNKATGQQLCDFNGNGAGGATLTAKPTLTASDFVVI